VMEITFHTNISQKYNDFAVFLSSVGNDTGRHSNGMKVEITGNSNGNRNCMEGIQWNGSAICIHDANLLYLACAHYCNL